ncbi:hypothetical protein ACF0H5_011811 [Mactra antiquata]
MDTIEEEIDKIPYIDETDEELVEPITETTLGKKRVAENIDNNHRESPVHEQKQKYPKSTHSYAMGDKFAAEKQTEQDLNILKNLMKSKKQIKDLEELREDRSLPLNITNVNVNQHKPVSVSPVHHDMINEQASGDMADRDEAVEDKVNTDNMNDNENGQSDDTDGFRLKVGEDAHDKLQLIDHDWNSELDNTSVNIHDPSDKENHERYADLKNDNERSNQLVDKNGNNMNQMIQSQHTGMNEGFIETKNSENDNYNGAKPKLYTKRVNGYDMQLRELKLQNTDYNEDTDILIEKEKVKSNKRKNKSKHGLQEQCLTNSSSDIKIFITNEEGTATEAHISESTTETSINTLNKNITLSTVTSPSFETVSPDETSKSSTALNYLRKMSEDKEETKGNSLLKQQELYNQQKAKPFQRFSKVKTGMFEAGIEGDEKQSSIKAITITSAKHLVLFDRNNKSIKLFDSNFNPLDVLAIGAKYCRLTSFTADAFAASLPEKKKINVYKISNVNKIIHKRHLASEEEYFGIAYFGGKMFLTQRRRATSLTETDKWEVKLIDLNENENEVKTIRAFSPGHKDCTLHANEQGVYITNKIENEVLMLAHDGTFIMRHKVEFSLPVGITSDRYGNIYVCGGSVTSFIEIIKPDLKRYRVIYKKTSSNPVALTFDQDNNTLFVCDQILGKIIRYQIENNGTVHGLSSTSPVTSSPES